MATNGHPEPMTDTTALIIAPPSDVASPLPVFRGEQMAQALVAYKDLQRALDQAMPDQIMAIGDRQFRKKGYWRAVAVAFNLTVEPISETREVNSHFEDGRENFGHIVTYRATAPGGRSATGDGACFAVEKSRKFKCPHLEREGSTRTVHYPWDTCPDFDPGYAWKAISPEATEHNVRSHAHTRAFNRAVSNLCGFGEVSAEEMEREEGADARPVGNGHTTQARATGIQPPQRKSAGGVISEPQAKRLWAIAREMGWSNDEVHTLLQQHGFRSAGDITRDRYEVICKELQTGTEVRG